MAKNHIRPLSWCLEAARRLCTTAGAAAAEEDWKPLYRRLSALGRDPARSVAATMREWLREGMLVTSRELMAYVRQLRKYKNYHRSLELMEWMEKKEMCMTTSNHAVRLDLLSKVRGIDLAESYFSSLPELAKDKLTYGALLNSYCNEKMADKAIALCQKMKDLNIGSTALVHNNLMTLYMKLGQPEKVPNQFQEMKAMNILPDNFSYCILMNSYASQHDIDSVERVIQEMIEGGEVPLNWITYSNLAAHYKSAGLFKKADSALKKLEEVMDIHDREAYHHLISLYTGTGNLAEVIRVWKLLKGAFAQTTNSSYYVMLHALQKLDDIEALKQCFEEWESVYTSCDMRLVNVMIGAYLRKDMVQQAESLWKRAVKKSARIDFRTVELFIHYYLKNDKMDLAMRSLEAMASHVKQDEWKPNKEMVYVLLKYFEQAKDVSGAEAVCKSLKKLNCLDIEAYESLLRTYLAAGENEPSIHQRIKEDGIKIRSETEKLIESVCTTA